MGHRSWIVEVKNEKELDNVLDFIEKADEICDYDTGCFPEVSLKVGKRLFFGFYSDGSTCGEEYVQRFLQKGRIFGLLGEVEVDGEVLTPEFLVGKYFKSIASFSKELKPKGTPQEIKTVVRKIKEKVEKIAIARGYKKPKASKKKKT